jgi:hypothetical protein
MKQFETILLSSSPLALLKLLFYQNETAVSYECMAVSHAVQNRQNSLESLLLREYIAGLRAP